MSCASCESPFSNYLIAARDRYNSLSNSSSSRIQLVGDTIRHMIPVVVEGIKATALERKNMASYDTGVRYKLNDKNQMVYASGSFAGLRPSDLHDRTARLNPDLYNPEDLKVDLATEAAFQARATKVISTYHRVGNDNRNINIYELDPETKIISLRVINTATDGNNHAYDRIVDMAKKQFADFNIVSPSGPNGPEDHVFVMSDVEVPREKIKETMGMSGIKENDLEIKETIMKFEAEAGKIYAKDQTGKNIDIENSAGSELERKQKHRFVGRVKTAFNCAVEEGKPATFFYAPKDLSNGREDGTLSQILVDAKGNVILKTINLSEHLADFDLKELLLKLGYPGQSPTREFSYADDSMTNEKMKEIVKNGLAEISARNRFEFLTLRVFPVENRFDFLRQSLNTDRIITNNSVMYFHDIAISRGVENAEKKSKNKSNIVETMPDFSRKDALSALVVFAEGIYGIDRVVENSVDETVDRNVFEEKNEEGLLILNQAVNLQSEIHKKKSKYSGKIDTGDDNDGDSPAPATYIHVDREDDEPSRKYAGQENGKPNPKNPIPQSPTKMYLEEENLTNEKKYFFADPLVDSPLFRKNDQGRHLVQKEIIIRQEEEESEIVAKIAERIVEVSAERKNNFHYHDLNHDSEQAQKNVKLIFPEIKNSFPIGERVEMEKQQQEQMEQIWAMFLNLYFGIQFGDARKEVKSSKSSLKFVAEQEVRSPINFFNQTQFLPYMRVFAILLICILKLSKNI